MNKHQAAHWLHNGHRFHNHLHHQGQPCWFCFRIDWWYTHASFHCYHPYPLDLLQSSGRTQGSYTNIIVIRVLPTLRMLIGIRLKQPTVCLLVTSLTTIVAVACKSVYLLLSLAVIFIESALCCSVSFLLTNLTHSMLNYIQNDFSLLNSISFISQFVITKMILIHHCIFYVFHDKSSSFHSTFCS